MRILSKLAPGLFLALLAFGCGGGGSSVQNSAGRYATTFQSSEDPISEGGNWVNGGAVGIDWANVSITQGRAIGLETGANFTDATAVLQNRTWQPDQKARAVVFTVGPLPQDCSQEVELRLRTVIAPHSITGYEVNYRTSTTADGYMQIVRWDGAIGNFTVLQSFNGQEFGVTNGDTVMATIVGNVVTAYKNGVQQGQVTDTTYTNGSPGMGFNLDNTQAGCSGRNSNYGFTSFTAVDSSQGSF
jgi:hypothetical protein